MGKDDYTEECEESDWFYEELSYNQTDDEIGELFDGYEV